MLEKQLEDFYLNLRNKDLMVYFFNFINGNNYFSSSKIAKNMIYEKLGIDGRDCANGTYHKCVRNIASRISKFINPLLKAELIEKFNKSTYRKVKRLTFEDFKKGLDIIIEFDRFLRAWDKNYLYLSIPIDVIRNYTLLKDKKVKVKIEILE